MMNKTRPCNAYFYLEAKSINIFVPLEIEESTPGSLYSSSYPRFQLVAIFTIVSR